MSHDQSEAFSEKRLARATKHVGDYWIPVNAQLLEKIKHNLSEGSYENNARSLINDIKSDFSLFTFCLRELITMMRDGDNEIETEQNPIELLEQSGLETLKSILQVSKEVISPHTLEAGSSLQISRFEETLLSASTAEVLSKHYGVDEAAAYSTALLRQLGYTLVAWNYPAIYQESVQQLQPGDTLDLVLTKELGFSPATLALRVLHGWGVSGHTTSQWGMLTDEDLEEVEILNSIGGSLAKLCKVGEALARANHPDCYPTARDDWKVARLEIESRLGPQGMEVIKERYLENCENYLTYLPDVFLAAVPADFEDVYTSSLEDKDGSATGNPFVGVCNESFRSKLEAFYAGLNRSATSRHNVRRFVHELIPNTDFSGGCVFTIDPGMMLLVPQLKIPGMKFREFEPVDYSLAISKSDLVAVAFQNSEPILEYHKTAEGEVCSSLAGVFGASQKVGVLYLEIPKTVPNDPKSEEMLQFKALAWTLNDCLKLD